MKSSSASWRRRRAALVALVLVLIATAMLVVAVRAVGPYLVVADPLERSDAIFVLSGRTPARELEAAELYRQGLAGAVVLAHGVNPLDVARELAGEPPTQERSASILERLGVPRQAIAKLDRRVENTHEELAVDFEYARDRGLRRVIFVTSPAHTRRVRTIWNALYQATIPALVHPTPHDPFDAPRWWRSRRSVEDGLHEVFGILHFRLGSPLPTYDRTP